MRTAETRGTALVTGVSMASARTPSLLSQGRKSRKRVNHRR